MGEPSTVRLGVKCAGKFVRIWSSWYAGRYSDNVKLSIKNLGEKESKRVWISKTSWIENVKIKNEKFDIHRVKNERIFVIEENEHLRG